MKNKEERKVLKEEELAQVSGGNNFPTPAPCHMTMVEKPPAGKCEVALDIPECADCPSNPINNSINNPYNPGLLK